MSKVRHVIFLSILPFLYYFWIAKVISPSIQPSRPETWQQCFTPFLWLYYSGSLPASWICAATDGGALTRFEQVPSSAFFKFNCYHHPRSQLGVRGPLAAVTGMARVVRDSGKALGDLVRCYCTLCELWVPPRVNNVKEESSSSRSRSSGLDKEDT